MRIADLEKLTIAKQIASMVFQKEKQRLIGSLDDDEAKCSSFFLLTDDGVLAIRPAALLKNIADEEQRKNLVSLIVRLSVHITQAWGVIHLTEGWALTCCGKCGGNVQHAKLQCSICGCEVGEIAPSESKYSTEVLMCTMEMESDTGMYWSAAIKRNDQGRLASFNGDDEGHELKNSQGRMMQWWTIYSNMAANFIVNYPIFAKVFGKRATEDQAKAAMWVKSLAPEGYPIVEFIIDNNFAEQWNLN